MSINQEELKTSEIYRKSIIHSNSLNWKIAHSFTELTTFNSTIYNWYSIRSNDGWDALRISVKAYENVHIALSNSTNTAVPPIEIQIGQNRGRDSYILDQNVTVFSDNSQRRLNETASKDFIIGWRFGIVMVFVDGEQFPFMAYNMKNRYSVDFFGLRTV